MAKYRIQWRWSVWAGNTPVELLWLLNLEYVDQVEVSFKHTFNLTCLMHNDAHDLYLFCMSKEIYLFV